MNNIPKFGVYKGMLESYMESEMNNRLSANLDEQVPYVEPYKVQRLRLSSNLVD